MKLFLALFFAIPLSVAAQSPQVPHKMQFADITLTIRDDARHEIQKDVDAFTKYQKSFNIKAERAKTYFPIIEKIFAEENVPDDMKYLVIQESALISDAVSTSNAVGFWQFKDFTAVEMGLRVDREVDERLNIVSSSRAAARYLKKNNGFFDNWLYALQAYQMGAGGVMRSEKDHKSGKKHLEITSKTYWYVKKYLAHKIAYEGAVKGAGEISVITYQTEGKRKLSDLAKELAVDNEELKTYNKWAKSDVIPADKSYAVIIPVKGNSPAIILPEGENPVLTQAALNNTQGKEDRIKINGISAIKALPNETATALATRVGVERSSLLKYNDLSAKDRLYPGQYYLLGKKRNRATTAFHKVAPGENLWMVSQQYGVKLKRLKRYNRMRSENEVKPGMTLWLSSMKPKDAASIPKETEVIEVDEDEAFIWGATEEVIMTTPAHPGVAVKVEEPEVVAVTQHDSVAIDTVELTKSENEAVASADSVQTLQEERPDKSGIDSVIVIKVPVAESTSKTMHVVQPKETLYAIAKLYNLGVMDLVNWNNLNIQDGIKPGQTLKLSDPQAIAEEPQARTESITIEHEVKPTDTVYSISRKYGVTIKELMEWNSKKDFTLSIGEKLRIIKK